MHYSLAASCLVACILSSHTLVAFPIVSRYGLTRYPGVTLAIVATMISLVLALLGLAGLSGSLQGEEGWSLWLWLLVKCALFVTGLFYVYPRLIRFFFRTFSDDVLQYIFVLVLVFLSAAVSQALGLEGVLGAFLAGLIFGRYIPEAVPLMRHIDFVGNALFIPYFLIGVGMLINLPQMFARPDSLLFILFFVLSNSTSVYPVSPVSMFQNAPGPPDPGNERTALSSSERLLFSFSTKLTSMLRLNV